MKIKHYGLVAYRQTLNAMRDFTLSRGNNSPDELWFCEHPPVFTLGRHANKHHLINPHGIEVIQTDRGGEVTYHGPGQMMVYCLTDLRRLKTGVKGFVAHLESSVIHTLGDFGINAHTRDNMPGVYVDNAKICSLGLRVKHGCTYHGLAINVDMDLAPFSYINPCGYQDLKITRVTEFQPNINKVELIERFVAHYSSIFHTTTSYSDATGVSQI